MTEIEDRLAIMELTARYNRACYDLDLEAFGDCFTPDGRYVQRNAGRELDGREAIVRQLAEEGRAEGGGVQHFTGDFVIELDADRATQRCTMILFTRETGNAPNQLFATGYYEDELVRTPDGWRFAQRRSTLDRTLPGA